VLTSARILLAEDQPEVMKIVLRILKSAGHDVVGAESDDLAFELYQSSKPFDLLLTDIVMPGELQRPTLARKLRAMRPTLPVVFMTGYAREAAMHGNGLREEDIRLMRPVSRT
jgi:CheY-like chemotaxis protein